MGVGRYHDGVGVSSVLRRGLTRGSVALGIVPAEICEIPWLLELTSGEHPSSSICDCLRFPFTVSDSTEEAWDGPRIGCNSISMEAGRLADEIGSNGTLTMKGSKSANALCRTHSSIQPGWIAFCERRNSPSIRRVVEDKIPSTGASTMMKVASLCSSSIPPFAYRQSVFANLKGFTHLDIILDRPTTLTSDEECA